MAANEGNCYVREIKGNLKYEMISHQIKSMYKSQKATLVVNKVLSFFASVLQKKLSIRSST